MTYPGGKNGAGVYQRIINLIPPHEVYIEPFLGSGAVMRLKRPARLNIGLDLADSAVSAMVAALASFSEPAASSLPASAAAIAGFSEMVPGGSGIARSREDRSNRSPIAGTGDIRRRSSPDSKVQACHGGNGGAGSVFRDRASPDSPMSADLASSGDTVLSAGNGDAAEFRLLRGDGIEYLNRYSFTGNEVVYCDPPYLMSTRSGRAWYEHEMSDVDHRRLLRVIRKISARVLISGYWSKMYATTLRDWNFVSFDSMTRVGHATEWLWYNFETPLALHDYRYLGQNFRERERINRKKRRWTERLKRMPLLERQALLCAISSIDS